MQGRRIELPKRDHYRLSSQPVELCKLYNAHALTNNNIDGMNKMAQSQIRPVKEYDCTKNVMEDINQWLLY